MEWTVIKQVLYIIWLKNDLWETRFLVMHSNFDFIKKNEVVK